MSALNSKGKITVAVIVIIVVFSILGMILLTYTVTKQGQQLARQGSDISQLSAALSNLKALKDGQTPACFHTPTQCQGRDGNDSVSITTVIKEVNTTTVERAIPGPAGPFQETRLNPQTKDLETKMSNDDLWVVVIPCAELIRSCPVPAVSIPVGNPFEIGEL